MRDDTKPLTTGQVARYCGVSRMGVIRWIRQGKLKAYTTPGGHYRIRVEDFQEFLRRFDIPLHSSFHIKATPRVLVMTDNTQTLGIIVKALSTMPERCEIELVLDGSSAMAKIPELKPTLVILDATALEANGPHAVQQLSVQFQQRGIPTLILETLAAKPIEEKKPSAAAPGQILLQYETLDVKTLQSAVRELLNG